MIIHQRNVKVLGVEMYKPSRRKSPELKNDLVKKFETQYHTRARPGVERDEDGNVKSLNRKHNIVHKNSTQTHMD